MSTQQEHINNAFFRIITLSKVIENDSAYFLPLCKNSGLKNILSRIKNSIISNVNSLTGTLSSESQKEVRKAIREEKIASIQNILSRLVMMNEEDLGTLENQILQVTQVENKAA